MGCSLCRLIRRPEHLIGRHWYLPANWRWSPHQWVSQCYVIECYRSFYCALLCVFMTHVSQCEIGLRSEHPKSEMRAHFLWEYYMRVFLFTSWKKSVFLLTLYICSMCFVSLHIYDYVLSLIVLYITPLHTIKKPVFRYVNSGQCMDTSRRAEVSVRKSETCWWLNEQKRLMYGVSTLPLVVTE
jgi:hypothetical protein